MPSAKPKSPTRLTTKALIAAALALASVPETDQQVGGEAHAFPAEEHLHQVVRRHQHQHGEGEQRQIGKEARLVADPLPCSPAIEVHERRDRVTTTSMIAVSGRRGTPSRRPRRRESIQRSTRMSGPAPCMAAGSRSSARTAAARTAAPVVTTAGLSPMIAAEARDQAPSSGQKDDDGDPCPSALHHVDVFDRDRAAVAEEDDENGQADRGLAAAHGQHEQAKTCPTSRRDARERHEVDVHRQQHQLDRHQDDDDVLAVQEDAEDADT